MTRAPNATNSTARDMRGQNEAAADERRGAEPAATPHILVVDDTEGNRYAVSRLLRAAGMRVTEAATGHEAIRLVAAVPDLVVLDIKLPDMTGYEICHRIKTDPATAFVPVMHLSASYTGNADRAFGLEAGADAYLTHPIDPDLFLATTRALLRAGNAERAFRRAALEWRTTFDAIGDAIFLLERSGVVRRCNRAAADLLGRHPSDLVGLAWEHVVLALDVDSPNVLGRIVQEPVTRGAEVRVRDRWYSVSTGRAVDDFTAASLVVCVLADVTERRAAQEERDASLARAEAALHDAEAARHEAESANRAKSDFLAVMSHELRTPLNAIAGFTELIALGVRGPVTTEQLADLERIRRSQLTLLGLINDLLSFAKLESGSVHYDIADMAADRAMATAGEFVEVQVRAKHVQFVRVPCAAPLALRADPDKVQQILLNLLSNALKFTDAGGTIAVACAPNGSHVDLRVSDTGAGVPPDKLEAIFDPFVQVDQRLVREHRGVGLGLAISRELARGMGGDLTVQSAVGKGSTFTLSLPRSQAR